MPKRVRGGGSTLSGKKEEEQRGSKLTKSADVTANPAEKAPDSNQSFDFKSDDN